MTYSSRTADKFVVRLPDGLRERIAVHACTAHRSMNSHVVHFLEKCVELEDAGKFDLIDDILNWGSVEAPGQIVAVKREYRVNDPVCREGHLWVITMIYVLDGVLTVQLERRLSKPHQIVSKVLPYADLFDAES